MVLAGAFENIAVHRYSDRPNVEYAARDLDRREREFYTFVDREKPFVFLVQPIPRDMRFHRFDDHTDLFRRVMRRQSIDWFEPGGTVPNLRSRVPEFRTFIERYGTATIRFQPSYTDNAGQTVIAGSDRSFCGFELRHRIFFLPCHSPDSHQEALNMAAEAIRAVRAYRERISEEMPEWSAEFRFTNETALRNALDQKRAEIARLETELDAFLSRKGALCYRSDPLVRIVISILTSVFDLRVESEEKSIEDGRALDDEGRTIAVVEIKGVNGNFTRKDVNQVDSHRERLELSQDIPGLLIMNTGMNAESLADKDEPPHPDISKKAVQDHVLLIRTLDLLGYVDLIETNKADKAQFRTTILNESGWLRVEDNVATVVQS